MVWEMVLYAVLFQESFIQFKAPYSPERCSSVKELRMKKRPLSVKTDVIMDKMSTARI